MIEPTPRYHQIALRCLYASLIITMIVFAVALVFWLTQRSYKPLRDYENIKVHEITDDSGRYLVVQVTRCNRDDKPVTIFTSVSAELQNGIIYVVPLGVSRQVLQPGCSTSIARYDIPEKLTPGQWELLGLDTLIGDRGQIQAFTWTSPLFEVLDG